MDIKPIRPTLDPLEHKQNLVNKLPEDNITKQKPFLFLVGFIIILLGFGSGWAISGITKATSGNATPNKVNENNVATSEDIETSTEEFPEIGEGILRDGGINGEGTHHLDRDGADNIALLSTVLSLDSFLGSRVQVWGKWQGNLVDISKVKVLK